jgi:cytochrome c biogenesis protein CcmG, thiol:disulfide interchange protein DsbE
MTVRAPDADAPARSAPPGPEPASGGSRAVGIVVASVIVLLVGLLGIVLVQAQRAGGLPFDPVGSAAPTFELPALGGGEIGLAEHAGEPVVLAFWASWCTTCKADIPVLERTVERWGPHGVAVVGVVIDDTYDAAAGFAVERGLPYPSAFDGDGEVRAAFGVTGTPETYVIDADGRVAAKWIGPLPEHELDLTLAGVTG